MRLEEVTVAIERAAPVKCKFGSYILTGIVSRFEKHSGWRYSLELRDRKTNSLIYISPEEVDFE